MNHSDLVAMVTYEEETGVFMPKTGRRGVRPGHALGAVEKNGYIRISINGQRYLAHRLAWFYVTGTWPSGQIDHKNCDKADNRFVNLRIATPSQNHGNIASNRGMSGLKGAHFNRRRDHWQSSIKIMGKSMNLGRFETKEDAHAAYKQAADRLFGEFARV